MEFHTSRQQQLLCDAAEWFASAYIVHYNVSKDIYFIGSICMQMGIHGIKLGV